MYTLCVIDMQPTWKASQKYSVVTNVIKEIEEAKKRQCAIVLVRMLKEGPIDRRILDSVEDYDKVAVVGKYYSDGSRVIQRAINRHGFPKDCLRFCGVNTDECVADTVNSLAEIWPKSKMEIARRACNSHRKVSNRVFKKLRNIVVIRREK